MIVKLRSLFSICLLIISASTWAQQFRPFSSAQIFKQLQQLERVGTVMYIAAHPDDENTRLITYLINHDHINTIYLSLTRGDGGQNIIGNEQGPALGLIRSNEMMMARKIDGGKQLFTRFIDFGFTKSPIETFKFWDKAAVVQDIKKAIQQYQPDVLICRFPTTGEGGHGQHTASAIAALDAFNELQKSTNPNVWKPKRILFNAYRFGSNNTIKDGQFQLQTNQYDPILGEAFGEVAGRSRSEHKSQGAGTPQTYGISSENFELMAGSPIKNSLYDDVDTTWARLGMKTVGTKLNSVLKNFDFTYPEKSITSLLEIRKVIEDSLFAKNSILERSLLETKIADLDRILLSCAGVQLEVLADSPNTALGTTMPVEVRGAARAENIKIRSMTDHSGRVLAQNVGLENDKIWSIKDSLLVDEKLVITEPFWLKNPSKNNQYDYPYPYQNEALSINDFVIEAKIEIGGKALPVKVPVSFKRLDPTKGDVIEAVKIVPAVNVKAMDNSVIVEPGKSFDVKVEIAAREAVKNGRLEVRDSAGKLLNSKSNINLESNQNMVETITISPSTAPSNSNGYLLFFSFSSGSDVFTKTIHEINYDHIPSLQYFTEAQSNIIVKNWKNKVQLIGYIPGAGDKVAESLSELGMEVRTLTLADLSNPELLKQYDAIVCGVRIANVRKDLVPYLPNLWKYIEDGGNVLMQYNTSRGLLVENFSPLPIQLSNGRVTDEKAVVSILDAKSPVMNEPNVVTTKDFDNWVQERGIYYPETWDKAYSTVFSMHDADEKPLTSGILYAPYGRGHFVYTSLAFFRQLPAGNPGAIRLFLNLLSLGK